MEQAAFVLLEPRLRAYFARECVRQMEGFDNPLDRFVRPLFRHLHLTSLEDLEYQHYCIVLARNIDEERTGRRARYFGRDSLLRPGVRSDLYYCAGLRNRYFHPRGRTQTVPSLTQFSDLTV